MIVERTFVLLFAEFIFDGGTFVTMKSAIDCARLCVKTFGCSSFFYSENLESCMISATRYGDTTGLTPQTGYNYYRMPAEVGFACLFAADCPYQNSRCYQDTCDCQVGFSYDPRNQSCVTECSVYGDAFSTYEGHGVYYCNIRVHTTATPEKCMQTCLEENSFVCINVEFDTVYLSCNLCDSSWFDISEVNRDTDSPDWNLYYRHCGI